MSGDWVGRWPWEAKLRERGWSYARIAKKCGFDSHHVVVESLKKAGLWKRGLGAATNWSHRGRVDVEKAREMRARRISLAAIAREMKVSHQAIAQHLTKYPGPK